jgi:hypothetical protein
MRDPEFILKIAADSVAKLRAIDLDRVLFNCSDEELPVTAAYIIAHRPDLAAKVEQKHDYQLEERHATE